MPLQIPESPAELANPIPDDEVDINVKYMLSGNEVRELTLDRGHGAPAVGLLGGIVGGNGVGGINGGGDGTSAMSTLSVQGLISQLAAGLSGGGNNGDSGLGGDALSGLAASSGSNDIAVNGAAAVTTASMQPTVDLKQLGLDINLIAQLVAQHPNLSSTLSSTSASASSSSSSVNNAYGYGNGTSQAPNNSASAASGLIIDENSWNGGGSSQYGEYASLGQYEEDNVSGPRSRNWDSSSEHSWRGGRGGGKGGRGTGTGRGGSGFKHTKRKLCTFFANGR